MNRLLLAATASFALAGCSLVDSNGLHIGYSFDPQHFTAKAGDEQTPYTLPQVACTAGAMPDPCAAAQAALPATSQTTSTTTTVACKSGSCGATTEARLIQLIDLTKANTSLPSEAVQFGVSAVAIDRVAYWVASNTLNVSTPAVDLYVAPMAVRDETDAQAVKLGTVAQLPARSSMCNDPVDPKGDATAMGQKVCDVPLTQAGQAKLADFVRNYKSTPFNIIVRATLETPGGSPVPAGTLDLYVRPSVTLSILK